MSADGLKDEYVPKFISSGEDKFYRSLLFIAINKLVLIDQGLYKGLPPHIEYLDYYETFILLHRREGDEIYLKIAKMLRRAAHKIYRVMLKKNSAPTNPRFLNLV